MTDIKLTPSKEMLTFAYLNEQYAVEIIDTNSSRSLTMQGSLSDVIRRYGQRDRTLVIYDSQFLVDDKDSPAICTLVLFGYSDHLSIRSTFDTTMISVQEMYKILSTWISTKGKMVIAHHYCYLPDGSIYILDNFHEGAIWYYGHSDLDKYPTLQKGIEKVVATYKDKWITPISIDRRGNPTQDPQITWITFDIKHGIKSQQFTLKVQGVQRHIRLSFGGLLHDALPYFIKGAAKRYNYANKG